jgi:hypothetical protein
MSLTFPVCHEPMPWLKDEAPKNNEFVLVTELVCHEFICWLNDAALANIPPSSVTESVSQASRGWFAASAR